MIVRYFVRGRPMQALSEESPQRVEASQNVISRHVSRQEWVSRSANQT